MKKHSQFKDGVNSYNGIEFELSRKNIRNLIIKLNSKNKIVVSIPLRTPDDYLIKFLELNIEKFAKHALKKEENKSIDVDNNFFYLFGERVYYDDDKQNNKIIIFGKKISYAKKTKEEAINSYRKKQLKVYLLVKQLQYQKLMNIDDHMIKVREKTGAWATNHVDKKTVYYSINLSSYSQEIIDYVIIHELCHNKYPNHSKDFWKLVEKYEPKYKIKRSKLKKNIYK